MSYSNRLIAILSVSYCLTSVAGTMGDVCQPEQLSSPCNNSRWAFDIAALALKPVEDADFGYRTAVPENGFNHYLGWGHQYEWGFRLQAAYLFNNGQDINLNWSHVRMATNGDYAVPSLTFHHVLQWDAVNGEVGQVVDVGRQNKLRYYGGFQYLRLFASIDNYRNRGHLNHANSEFNGFGPRIGVDLTHQIGTSWTIYAKGSTVLTFGSSSFYDGIFLNYGSKDAIVPGMEGKLGATFSQVNHYGEFKLDGGFMWVNYFNGIHNTIGALGAHVGGFESDFGLAGPYVGLTYTV